MTIRHYNRLTPEAYERLCAKMDEDKVSAERVFPCNLDGDDLLGVMRIGDPGDRLEGRVGIRVRNGGDDAIVYISHPEARVLAAALLDFADELDGTQPLIFFDPDAPETEEPGYPTDPDAGKGSE